MLNLNNNKYTLGKDIFSIKNTVIILVKIVDKKSTIFLYTFYTLTITIYIDRKTNNY